MIPTPFLESGVSVISDIGCVPHPENIKDDYVFIQLRNPTYLMIALVKKKDPQLTKKYIYFKHTIFNTIFNRDVDSCHE